MKTKIFNLLAIMGLLTCFTSCKDDDELVFAHELPQFETRADAILLEVIMPQGTATSDALYIAGAFNGGEEAALADPRWQLEKAQGSDVKWGIYLYPSDFVEGTSLADGFYFVNKEQGPERTLRNEEAMHYDNPAPGTRTNITVNRWKSYFDTPVDPGEIVHDGFVIYVIDNTGYDQLAMYAWGDAEAFGGWPGITPAGKVTVDGVEFKYFDTGADNEGLNLNLIFNNNGNGQQLGDFNVTLNQDYYLVLNPEGVSLYDPSSSITHDGYAVFVLNNTGWADDALSLYMWGDTNDLNGGWPGMKATGKVKINGVQYLYFDMGEANTGLKENLIFSNDGANQLADFAFTIDRDIYLDVSTSVVEIEMEE